jgi:hypothetical protein
VGVPRSTPRAFRHRATAVLHPRARHRGRRPAHNPAPRHGHPDVQPLGRRLAVGPLAQERRRHPHHPPPPHPPHTHVHTRLPPPPSPPARAPAST